MKKIILASALVFSMYSCKKETILDEIENDKTMSFDNNAAESVSDDANAMADDAYNFGTLQSRGGSGGSTILGDTVKITKVDSTITIDFGTNGIVGKDGKTRKGKIKVTFSNGFKKAGANVTHEFINYFVKNGTAVGHTVNGSRTVTYNGANPNHTWTITSTLSIVRDDNGKTISWTSTRTRIMTSGANTPLNWTDDEYDITGTASGTSSNGHSFSVVINTPLHVKVGCKYIQLGILTFTRNTRTMTIDYGYSATSLSCDDKAKLTYNGTDYFIDL